MGSHRGDDSGLPEPEGPDASEPVDDAGDSDEERAETGDGGHDHFGLFDDRPDAADDDLPATGEFDLAELRDVLAGRGDPRSGSGSSEDDGDDDGDDHDAAPRPPRSRRPAESGDRHRPRGARARRRRHPVRSTVIALVVLALIAGGVTAGVIWWQHRTAAPQDWAGTGAHTLVIRVQSGDGLYDVGQTLAGAGVVASGPIFVSVAADDGRLSGLQPGYYLVHEHSSAQSAVDDLANPDNRLGRLRIIPGDTIADFAKVSTTGEKGTKPGILSKIVDSCVPSNGAAHCFTVDELRQVAATSSPSDLGVVGWATEAVSEVADPARRLEGLILPGDYDIAPGSTAFEALRAVVSASAAQWNTTGIVAAAKKQDFTPYQLATVASLVQAEGIGEDMPKVARVIYNRLDDGMKLQFDSTVNYGLDRASISTTEAERLNDANAYSTYAHEGLTPTPIGAPGPDALDAADDPAAGPWLYFVAIDLEGHSCFSATKDEHDACVDQARANGVFG
jgi:UPF0755 protein